MIDITYNKGQVHMRASAQLLATYLVIFIAVFLLSNTQNAVLTKQPDMLRLYFTPKVPMTTEEAADQVPGTSVADSANHIVQIPYGKLMEYSILFSKIPGVDLVRNVPVKPTLSWAFYWFTLQDQLYNYSHGSLGIVVDELHKNELPFPSLLKQMLLRSVAYLFPAVVTAIMLSTVFALMAARFRRLGQLIDSVHLFLVGFPDFGLIIAIQFIAIYLSQFTDKRLIMIVQAGSEAPYLIPFLTTAIVPALIIYGTLRIAARRELAKPYVYTAKAKGISATGILLSHIFRNMAGDLLAVLPKATTVAITSMVVAEALCQIVGLGGYLIHPNLEAANALPITCIILTGIVMIFNVIYVLLRQRFIVPVKETDL
jgi:oligopeptide transport system permease protein